MEAREADRRRGDRRRADRRGPNDAQGGYGRRSDDVSDSGRSIFDPGWMATDQAALDTRLARNGGSEPDAQDTALARVYRTYAAARAAIGVGLVLVQGVGSLTGLRASEWMALVSLAYAVQAITLWLLPRFGALARPPSPLHARAQQRRRQWMATIGVDLLAFSALHLLEAGGALNFAALLVLPVLMAGVLTSRLLALGTAAAVALLLLVAAWRLPLGPEGPGQMLQSGLAGLGLFMITILAGELAARLAREELAARGSLELARQQAQLNRLVIEEMADGVLVVDPRLLVRAANPAARALLVDQGLSPPAPFKLDRNPAWATLLAAAEQALLEGQWPEAGRDVVMSFAEGHTRTLRVRVRFTRGRSLERSGSGADDESDPNIDPVAVLLLEDLRTLQARIRQDKLAAMGRVSAGIAHEIRNPLAAIAQANALMMEDTLQPTQQRLARMVADNVDRLKRLVDDVSELSAGAEPGTRAIDAHATVAGTAAEWARTMEVPISWMGEGSRFRVQIGADIGAEPLPVWFDPEHLRRVVVNLLDNALRHASGAPGSTLLLLTARDEHWAVLSVLSDGAPIAPDVERRLFEPFFSTRSRGSGLGLYICRKLCERHGGSIEYRPRPTAERLRNEFIVSLRRTPPWYFTRHITRYRVLQRD